MSNTIKTVGAFVVVVILGACVWWFVNTFSSSTPQSPTQTSATGAQGGAPLLPANLPGAEGAHTDSANVSGTSI